MLALRQVRVRYKQTLLGASWAIIQPVVQMALFTLVFSQMARLPSEGYPYPVFVYAGLLPWGYFAQTTVSAVGSLVNNAQLISKVYFPRLIIPLAAVIAGLVDFGVAAAGMGVLMLFYGVSPTPSLLVVPLLVAALMLMAAGVGTALGALNVSFRDLGQAMPFLMQVWLYATPVVYPASLVPGHLQSLLRANPMTGMIDAFRSAVLGRPLDVSAIAVSLTISIAVFVIGTLYFHHVERQFADVV